MHLYIVRHAEAVDLGEDGVQTDETRFLTAKGVKQSRRIGRLFRKLGVTPEQLWTSPLVRARQTSEHLLGELDDAPTPTVTDELAPPGDFHTLVRQAADSGAASIVLVGHEPFLGAMLHTLATGSTVRSMPMSKAAVACISFFGPADSRLLWLLPNRTIHALLAAD